MQHASAPGTLAVDLDGTLLRSDMLFESFWSALSRDWRSGLRSVAALSQGRAALKRALAGASDVDVTTLPYDAAVIERVRDWRARGGRTALVTASDQAIAEAVAAHLGLFDEVHGSDGDTNLKGEEKAAFLETRYGAGNFAYMGDSRADLAVWARAGTAITVNAPQALRDEAAARAPEIEHVGAANRSWKPYLKALRPHQWMKNVLVLLPMLAAHQFIPLTLLQSLGAFLAFSLVASSVYVVNDLLDLSADRAHPRKRNRPFAAGAIPIADGSWMAAGLIGAGTLVSVLLGMPFLIIIAVYFITTTAYSLVLKRRAIIDICTLALLYTLRIIAGGTATGIPLSVWLLAFSIFFFLSLAAVKRQAELVDTIGRDKEGISGRGYTASDLSVISMMAIASGYVSVLVMALYVNSINVMELYSAPAFLWGICLVLLYWISRVVMIAHRGHMHDDPVIFAVRDKISRGCLLVIVGFAVASAIF
ncbi:UbiA family prenyltransferase [Tropicimonas sp. IMCC6043]|uniref:UbiA family prenyltransferase n=1 Tax=Tropicimonas sp. IMCC6043 TaxID=2510645 RepID=UPI00101C31E9|nr:UbiA family prenyltransferase [Tropicimonas sp. IMCC6043]RYH10991.1 UbiA family prenyltransferase [Tropicimonas sp. IMCC6043]